MNLININLIIYFDLNPKPGSVAKSTFEVSHNISYNLNKETERVDWIAGGISLIRRIDIIKNEYFNFEGKAYCEDLIHSNLLKDKGVKLFISNKSFCYTKIQSYKDLKVYDFIEFIKNDLRIRNHFRRKIKNPLLPFLLAYCLLILNYLITKIVMNLISFKKKFIILLIESPIIKKIF